MSTSYTNQRNKKRTSQRMILLSGSPQSASSGTADLDPGLHKLQSQMNIVERK